MIKHLILLFSALSLFACGPQKKRKQVRDKKFIASLKEEGNDTYTVNYGSEGSENDPSSFISILGDDQNDTLSEEEFFKMIIQKTGASEEENSEKVFKKTYDVKMENGSPGKYHIREEYLEEGNQYKRWASYDGIEFVELAKGFWSIEGTGTSARFKKFISGQEDTTCVRSGKICISCYQQSTEETLCLN